MDVHKGIIYYSDGRLDKKIADLVWSYLLKSMLPITSNILPSHVKPSYPTMVRQIIACLEEATTENVFFCEHDVLYSPTHFDFTPPRDDTYYYNEHLWRWEYPKDRYIRYDGLTSLSQMCCNRLLALGHYKKRLEKIEEKGYDKLTKGEPDEFRKWGYEPGTKKTRNGGFADEKSERWRSSFPNIDIRHKGTYSPSKTYLKDFKHAPTGWEETTRDKIEGWNT